MVGVSTMGSISFGTALVTGRKRVPSPAAGMTTLRKGCFMAARKVANGSDTGQRYIVARMRRTLLLLLLTGTAMADNRVQDPGSPWPTTVDTPRATAMGGAHAAIATGNDALAVNPAGLAQVRRYHFELDGMYDSRFPAQAILASLVDSASAPIASGLLWSRWASGQPSGRGEGWSLGLGYSGPIGQGLFLGGGKEHPPHPPPPGAVLNELPRRRLLRAEGQLPQPAAEHH